MLIIAWTIALALLTLAFNRWQERQNNPNYNPVGLDQQGVREVVLQSNHQHHYLATGKINQQTVTFLLDTGASDVVIPQPLAHKLKLRQGAEQYANTANGVVSVYATRIEQLQLGNIHLNNIKASINPAMQSDEVLLGMSALRHIEFSQRGDQLILRQYPNNSE